VDRAEEIGVLGQLDIKDNMMVIEHGQNTINAVGFRKSSGDQKSKLKSLANYNCVIIEEADEISEADFMQLDDTLRTIKGDITVILLLNPPPKSHWIIKRFFNLVDSGIKDFYIPELKPEITDTIFIGTTYLDNIANISEQSVRNYENYKTTKPEHYYNVVKGLVPEVVRGRIYKGWAEVDEVPHHAKLLIRGLDFGYSVDPTAIVDVYSYDGGYILHETCYQTEMSNANIAQLIALLPEPATIVIADSSEPKSIAEIKKLRVNIVPAEKGPDSVRNGIQVVQDQRISYTKDSIHLKEEYENYAWFENKDGDTFNEPNPKAQDHMMDAIRYAIDSLVKKPKPGPAVASPAVTPFYGDREMPF
jgi:phage terminase large subunit